MKNTLIVILLLAGSSSCSNYYQAITSPEPTKSTSYNNFRDSLKYYVLRNGSESFAMKNISVTGDGKNIQCILEVLPAEHKLHAYSGTNSKMKYKTKNYSSDDESGVLNEVHIYLNPGSKAAVGAYTLALENVQKTEIIEKNRIKTRNSHLLGTTIGIGSSVLLAGVIVAAVVASSFSVF